MDYCLPCHIGNEHFLYAFNIHPDKIFAMFGLLPALSNLLPGIKS